jgi:hypothetical protein
MRETAPFLYLVAFRYYRFDGIETASALIIDFKLFVLDNPK